jgi:predicted phosphohydrolase
MKLAWLTDLHLNFLEDDRIASFCADLATTKADAFAITGDIAHARNLIVCLEQLAEVLPRPIYFVLGNHDFYHGSIPEIRSRVEAACIASRNLHWMPRSGVIPLTTQTCLVGHDGWADGCLGNYERSDVELNDFHLIRELTGLNRAERLKKIQDLGDEAAAHLCSVLPDALARFRHVIVLIHVPPFKESCWHEGRISDHDWLPFMTCKAVGDVLRRAMEGRPNRGMTVLCGHTHSEGTAQILPNLKVLTGGAEYGSPKVEGMLEVG